MSGRTNYPARTEKPEWGGASSRTVEVARSTHSTLSKDGGRQPTGWANQEASWPLGPMGKCMPEQSSGWFLRMCSAYRRLGVAEAEVWVFERWARRSAALGIYFPFL